MQHPLSRSVRAVLATALLALAVSVPLAGAIPRFFSYSGPPVAIPDNSATPARATIFVAGLATSITDVDFWIGGSSCTTAVGATTVGIDHPFLGDLRVQLTSPAGTSVVLINRIPTSGNNLCQVLLDDDAGAPGIESAAGAPGPFTGTWAPANPLSAFDGQNPNGNWIVTVNDRFVADTGSIRAVGVVIDASEAKAEAEAPAATSVSTQASGGGLLGTPVNDVATIGGGSAPTGTVTFRLFSDAECTVEVFTSTNAVAGATATSGWFAPAADGTYYWTAGYSGDAGHAPSASPCGAPNESVTITAFTAPAPTRPTVTGDVIGPITVGPGESVVISGARVVGPVTVEEGGALTVVDSRITGGVSAVAPAFFSMCGSQVSGPSPGTALSVTFSEVPVRIGDPAAGCAGNRFAGPVTLADNLALTFGANLVSHATTVEDNGPGQSVLKANTFFAALGCTGNDPAPVNAGEPNTGPSKTGQCVGL